MEIKSNKSEFINDMIGFKTQLESSLNRSIYDKEIEEIRKHYIGRISKKRFKEYLVKKTTLHITFKYIMIRMSSESQNLVQPKFNKEGIRTWGELSKNYRKDYYLLFKYACKDLERQKETRSLFEQCIYDNYIDKIKSNFFNNKQDNYIERLQIYDFKTLDPNTAVSLFDILYPSDDREKLEGFLEESKVTTELMKSLGLL